MNEERRGPTIGELLRELAAGEPRAANRLYARLWPVVFGYCYQRLRDPLEAEDAAQAAMAEILGRAAEIRAPEAAYGYARLAARKHCDRQTRRRRLGTDPMAEPSDARRHDPLMEFMEGEERREVVEALWSLRPTLRAVVVLYYLDGYRTGEIASFLGKSVEAVKKRLSDAREILKGRLAMVEGVLRDFGVLTKMNDRSVQRLLREVAEVDIGGALSVVAPELRAKLEKNLSPRILERVRGLRQGGERASESVRRLWLSLDELLEAGEIDLLPREAPREAGIAVAAIAQGLGRMARAAWLRLALSEVSVKSRQCGLFALELDAENASDPLLREGLRALVDGSSPDSIRKILRACEGGEIELIVEEGILAIWEGRLV